MQKLPRCYLAAPWQGKRANAKRWSHGDLVGLPGFEPGSLASEAKSLDQASRQPLFLLSRETVSRFVSATCSAASFKIWRTLQIQGETF